MDKSQPADREESGNAFTTATRRFVHLSVPIMVFTVIINFIILPFLWREPVVAGSNRGAIYDRCGRVLAISRALPNPVSTESSQDTKYYRFYPNDSTAAHVIAFFDADDSGLDGRASRPDAIRNGASIYLTIDLAIQTSLENALARQAKEFGARSVSAVVMDPVTGEILALANWPTFNLNDTAISDMDVRRNRTVTDVFEPGSAFNIFTGAIALEAGVVTADDEFNCLGHLNVNGSRFKCHHAHGKINYRRAMEVSCNVVPMLAAQKINSQKLYDGLRGFGFSQLTGIEINDEEPGFMRPVSEWSGLSNSMITLGQEISVTTLQLANATSSLANGGHLLKPHIIRRLTDSEGHTIQSTAPMQRSQPVSLQTARSMTSIMEGVVSHGTGLLAAVPPYAVAGKTGTAAIFGSDGTRIEDSYNSIFIGWFPTESPILAMAIVVHDPDPGKGYYGGAVAAPAFAQVAAEALLYLGIKSAREVRPMPFPQQP